MVPSGALGSIASTCSRAGDRRGRGLHRRSPPPARRLGADGKCVSTNARKATGSASSWVDPTVDVGVASGRSGRPGTGEVAMASRLDEIAVALTQPMSAPARDAPDSGRCRHRLPRPADRTRFQSTTLPPDARVLTWAPGSAWPAALTAVRGAGTPSQKCRAGAPDNANTACCDVDFGYDCGPLNFYGSPSCACRPENTCQGINDPGYSLLPARREMHRARRARTGLLQTAVRQGGVLLRERGLRHGRAAQAGHGLLCAALARAIPLPGERHLLRSHRRMLR